MGCHDFAKPVLSVIVAVVFITAISPASQPHLTTAISPGQKHGFVLRQGGSWPGPRLGGSMVPSPILMGQPGPKLALVQGNARNLASVGYIVTDNTTQLSPQSWPSIHITFPG